MREVEGKTAFITGGGSGVGLGMSKAFIAAGMRVAIVDIREDHLEAATAELGDRAYPIRLDVTDREAFARAADEAERALGNVHVLCNNAGINLFNDIAEATYQDWDWVLGVNLGGVVNGVVTFVPRIKAHGEGGHVVNTASMAAFVAGPGAGIYTTAKFAVHGLSDAPSLEPASPRDRRVDGLPRSRQEQDLRERPRRAAGALDRRAPADPEFMRILPGLHEAGMDPDDIGQKVLRAIRRNDFYVFTHPDHREELRRDLRRDARCVPRRAGARGPARRRGGPAGGEGACARVLARRLMRRSRAGPRSSPAARAGSGSAWRRRSSAPA